MELRVKVTAGTTSATFAVAGHGEPPPVSAGVTARLNGVSRTIVVPLFPSRGRGY